MANKKELTVEGIAVEITKHARSKSVRIKLQPHKPVRVTIPIRAAFSVGEHFLNDRLPWIKKNLRRLEEQSPRKNFGWDFTLPTVFGAIKLVSFQSENLPNDCENNGLNLMLPSDFDFDKVDNQKILEKMLIDKLKEQAKEYLPNRLVQLAKENGFAFASVALKNLKSRWGSCSAVNNINLNIHLIRLPIELIDYVLMHELQHTTIKNHSSDFWNSLEKKWPGSRVLDKQLNGYRVSWF